MTTSTQASGASGPESGGWFTRRRVTAMKGMAFALLSFPLSLWLLYSFWPADYTQLDEDGRFRLALGWLPLVGLFLFFMFTQTARLFDTKGAEEVLAGKESEKWKKNARIYQNTVEQAILFVIMLLALSTVVRPEEAQILPVLVCLWLFGRICFFAGYHIDPSYRAFGFEYTIFPSIVAGFWYVWRLIG